jgi:hypothetical protein
MATTRQGLSGFLIRLGGEPDLFKQYMKNRAGVMEREDVTPADRAAVLSGDLRKIRARLRNEYAEPEEEPPTIMVEPEEPPTIIEPEEEQLTIMEPEEPPTIMEPEEEPPTIMEPEEPKAKPEPEPQAE